MNLQDCVEVGLAPDLASFEQKLVRIAHDLDFGLVSAAIVVDRPGDVSLYGMAGNTPKAFVEASRRMDGARRDPVLKRLTQLSVPFTYDQSMYVEDDAADLWEEQAAHGYRTGVSLALHMGARHFLLGVDREQPLPEDDERLMALLSRLQLLAVYAQEAAFRLMVPGLEGAAAAPVITAREREVLQWTMKGKSAWAVGQVLSMSEHTVNFHLRNAMRKLGTSSKHQAAAKALSLGLI